MADHLHHDPPGFFFPNFLGPTRSIRSLFQDPFHGFQNLFSPMMGMGKNFLSSVGSMMDIDSDTAPNEGTSSDLFGFGLNFGFNCLFKV